MKLSEKFKESLIYLFLLCVLCFMMFTGCTERRETEDEKQSRFFKEEIAKRKLNKLY